jgi:hypothetical protein
MIFPTPYGVRFARASLAELSSAAQSITFLNRLAALCSGELAIVRVSRGGEKILGRRSERSKPKNASD